MFVFFKCVAEAVVEKGLRGLAEMVPGGQYACSLAESVARKYRERSRLDQQQAELKAMAEATLDDARRAALQAAKEVAGAGAESDLALELYLTQIPGAIRQSLKRPEDPTGRTVPSGFNLDTPDQVLKLLPARPPRFRPGNPLPGKPGWVLAELLGTGGFGEVWLARHSGMSSLSGAVKFCLGQGGKELKHEGAVVDRVMAAGKHPHIVPLIDVDLDGETPWLMYEYVPGGDLADLIRGWQKLPAADRVARAVAAVRTLADAVGHFHRLTPPLVHRDLKPANILLAPPPGGGPPSLRITDFGIGAVAAKIALADEAAGAGTSTPGGQLLGHMRGSHTPLYASPQQREGADPDPRDDVHALGVIGYQMITGNLSTAPSRDMDDDLKEAGAPEGLISLLGRCVAGKADRRPKDAAELAAALAPLDRAAPPPLPAAPPPPSAAPPAPTLPSAGLNVDRENVIRHLHQIITVGNKLIPTGKKVGGILLMILFGLITLNALAMAAMSDPEPEIDSKLERYRGPSSSGMSKGMLVIGLLGLATGATLMGLPYLKNRKARSDAVTGVLSLVQTHRRNFPELGTLPTDPNDLDRVKQIGFQLARLLEKACPDQRVTVNLTAAAVPDGWSDTTYQVYIDERKLGPASYTLRG